METRKKEGPRMGLIPRPARELAETPGLLRVREAGIILQMCEAQIYTLAKAGQIPSYKIGKRRMFKLEELQQWIATKREIGQQVVTR